ncbi:signal peptidase I [Allomuricauda sp. SCSIO 65647]|uniref:signal peptidase I n=1 Tax=Allomuricauda sp. SCSIO 65647 TaxID=2908843 RepID=UPI001F31AE3D|nr:signal peptidase I [Muricauda sp. SCSIO 65647]UJH67888.1 signal peptidase I [Muricauda sp. SCSIO 65647]
MNGTQWIIFILVIQVVHFLGTWKLYIKAGRKAWEAAIPIYNGIVLMQIIRRPKWWVLLLFIPIINLLMFPVIWVETIRSFGKNKIWDTWLVILTLGFYIYYLNYVEDVQYIQDRSLKPRTGLGEWVSSIVFAIVAATFVHTYFIQPYVIPTGSLERTLRVGDFLFVSKMHYGARVPMTTIAAPMVHDTLPGLGVRSYLRKPQLPYMRLPGFQKVKRSDLVVISWPADTVRVFFKAEEAVEKPIDKKSNYVKRCTGVAGDSLEIIDGIVHINGKPLELPDRAKKMYNRIIYSQKGVSSRLLNEVGADSFTRFYVPASIDQSQVTSLRRFGYQVGADETGKAKIFTDEEGLPTELIRQLRLSLKEETPKQRIANMTDEMVRELKKNSSIDSVVMQIEPKGKSGYNVFPQNPYYQWNTDNFGPIYIPEAGTTVAINDKTIPLYKKIIRDYEHNEVLVKGNQVFINGKEADSYTFKQNYYWMMGDNRDHSEDSRAWGYVPENHIVGKPVFIWMSFDNFDKGFFKWRPRWGRFFTTVGGNGEPISYFKYFLLALAGWFIFDFFRKRRKSKT